MKNAGLTKGKDSYRLCERRGGVSRLIFKNCEFKVEQAQGFTDEQGKRDLCLEVTVKRAWLP